MASPILCLAVEAHRVHNTVSLKMGVGLLPEREVAMKSQEGTA